MTIDSSLGRFAEHGRLAAADQRAAQLAELHYIQELTRDAAAVVLAGWTQATWFAAVGDQGRRRAVDPQLTRDRAGRVFDQACLVGAIVHAAGGPAAVHTQLVQRTLDLTWHTLYRGPDRPVQWCPPPQVRQGRVRDLTRWNDQPGRTRDEVLALLADTRAAAEAEAVRVRREGALTPDRSSR